MSKVYGFTYKKVKNSGIGTDETDYSPILRKLNSIGSILDMVYERDSKGIMHVHGLIEFNRCPYFKTLMFEGFAQKFEEIYDRERWLKYIHKDDLDAKVKSMEDDAKYCRSHYLFDDAEYNLKM